MGACQPWRSSASADPSRTTSSSNGQTTRATLVGIAVSYVSDGDTTRRVDDYALEMTMGEVLGVRQRLQPDDVVRLGMMLTVVVDRGAAVIEWQATCADLGLNGETDTFRWKALKTPPERGIVDAAETLVSTRKKGVPVSVRIEEVESRSALFGLATMLDLEVVVTPPGEEPYATRLKRAEIPFYASHLCRAGLELPGYIRPQRPDKVGLDWPAAAMREPGIGQPAAVERPGSRAPTALGIVADQGDPLFGVGGEYDARKAVDDAASSGTVIEGVTLETLVAVQAGLINDRVPPAQYDEYAQRHGVAAGTWDRAAAAWQRQMMTDWRLGAAYGEALAAAQKRR